MRARRFIDVLAVWGVLAALRLWAGWDFVATGRTADPDSVMRLLQVRDWLGGQGWFDAVQYRIGPAGGVAMHWTRLGDLLPGAITAALTPIWGAARAEHAAMVATPLILLFAATALTLGIVRALAGRAAPVAVAAVLATSLGAMTVFTPGNIDHHNLQLVLVLMLLRACVAPPTVHSGVAAGVAVVASMVVGIETAPVAVAVLGAVALSHLARPGVWRAFVMGLGITLVAGALAAALVFMPRPATAFCDAWTPPIALLTAVLGAGFGIAAWLSDRGLAVRLGVPALVVLVGAAVIVAAFPACRLHPAGTNPLLWRYWMNNISENQSLAALVRDHGVGALGLYLGVAPAVFLAICAAPRMPEGARSPALFALLAAFAVTLLHVRGQVILGGIAAPLAAALIARAFATPGWRRIAIGVVLLPLPWLALGALLARAPANDLAAKQAACRAPALMAALDRLAPTTLIVPMMVEPHILAATHHRSLAATYHRNQAGNIAMIAAMVGRPAPMPGTIARYGVGAIVYCPGFDTDAYARANPASLAAALAADRVPTWLILTARLPGDVRVYRIDGGR